MSPYARLRGQRYPSPPKSGAFGSRLLSSELTWTGLAAHLVMVDESATATRNLEEQAGKLVEAVQVFGH